MCIKGRVLPWAMCTLDLQPAPSSSYLGSAELISSHRQRVADVDPHSDDNNENPPDFGQGMTKFP